MLDQEFAKIKNIVTELHTMDLSQLDDAQLKRYRKLASTLTTLSHRIEVAAQNALSIDDQALMPEIQAMWPLYAEKRGRKPDAEFSYVEWAGGYQADGIKLGSSVREAYDFLKSETT